MAVCIEDRSGRCCEYVYCSPAHLQQDWPKHYQEDCWSEPELLATDASFSIDTINTRLRPRRGSTDDPYEFWPMNAHAAFTCGHCKRRWSSAKASLVFSLLNMSIVRVYQEKCVSCELPASPCFTDLPSSLIRLFVWLRDLSDKDDRPAPGEENVKTTDPHLTEHCERCGYGTRPHDH